jgi:hypothetical protein
VKKSSIKSSKKPPLMNDEDTSVKVLISKRLKNNFRSSPLVTKDQSDKIVNQSPRQQKTLKISNPA